MIEIFIKIDGKEYGFRHRIDSENKIVIEKNLRKAFDNMASSTLISLKQLGYTIE